MTDERREQTDAEKYVRSIWPEASCHGPVLLYWPGQGERKRYVVTKAMHVSRSGGEGLTEVEAWVDAANRLEAKRKEQPNGR